jgi:hypothetical protein
MATALQVQALELASTALRKEVIRQMSNKERLALAKLTTDRPLRSALLRPILLGAEAPNGNLLASVRDEPKRRRRRNIQFMEGAATTISPEQHSVLLRHNVLSKKTRPSFHRFIVPILSVLSAEPLPNKAMKAAITRRYKITGDGCKSYARGMTRWWNAALLSRQLLIKTGIVKVYGHYQTTQYNQLTDKGVALKRELGLASSSPSAVTLSKPASKNANGTHVKAWLQQRRAVGVISA